MNRPILEHYNAADEVAIENANVKLEQALEQHKTAFATNFKNLSNNSSVKNIVNGNGDTYLPSNNLTKFVVGSGIKDILSPTNVAPVQQTPHKENPIEEVVFAFDHLSQNKNEKNSFLTNGGYQAKTAAYFPKDNVKRREKIKSFIEFDDDENGHFGATQVSNKNGRPHLDKLRLLQKGGGSFDQTYYRNDEELKNVFSNENSNASSQTKINSLTSAVEKNARASIRSQESLEEVDWNDFQGPTIDDVIEEDKNQTFCLDIAKQKTNETTKWPPDTALETLKTVKESQINETVDVRNCDKKEDEDYDSDDDKNEAEKEEEEEEEEEGEEVMTENLLLNDDEDESNAAMFFDKMHQMEAEQDLLSNSLLALTSHFAQVQLRLRQIVEAKDVPVEKREVLLQELESFANRGIPELMMTMAPQGKDTGSNPRRAPLERSVSMATSFAADDVFEDGDFEDESIVVSVNALSDHEKSISPERRLLSASAHRALPKHSASSITDADLQSENGGSFAGGQRSRLGSCSTTTAGWITEEKLEKQRTRQKELIGQLKEQLEDLEKYAYETGELSSLPSSMLLERQNAIIEQLKSKLPVLTIDEIDKLGPEELRKKVDFAVKELVNPVLMKEQLVCQLKTQVTDLERFIEFLQKGGNNKEKHKHLLAQTQSQAPNSKFAQMSKFLKISRSQAKRDAKGKDSSKQNAAHSLSSAADGGGNQITSIKPTRHVNYYHKTNETSRKPLSNGSSNNGRVNGSTATSSLAEKEANESASTIMNRIMSLLHVFALTQLGGCASFAGNPADASSSAGSYSKSAAPFERNSLKSQTRHWGDLRAHLELAISAIVELYREKNMNAPASASELAASAAAGTKPSLVMSNYFAHEQMTGLVRKDLSLALRDLLQHGLTGALDGEGASGSASGAMEMARPSAASRAALIGSAALKLRPTTVGRVQRVAGSSGNSGASGAIGAAFSSNGYSCGASSSSSSSAVGLLSLGLGCFGASSSRAAGALLPSIAHQSVGKPVHAWEVVLLYYDHKNGDQFRAAPSRRLSQSFGLQVVSGTNVNPKHSLLAAIDDIIDTHSRHKRSFDSHFKAFVCMGLNQHMLSNWTRLVVRNALLNSDCYEKWSYAASTGFEDALRQLDKLSTLKFCLPTDLAIRQLQSIHDAF